jgi:hypothetical protein
MSWMETDRCTGEADVRLIVRLVCNAVGIRRCGLKFKRHGNPLKAFYHHRGTSGTIEVTPDASHATLLHEIAHHLHRTEQFRRQAEGTSSWHNNDDSSHGQNFRSCLIQVARAWYGDESRYPWGGDYAAIASWWRREAEHRKSIGE